MEKREHSNATVLLLSLVTVLGLVSFTLCFAAEFKRSKKNDLRLNGKLCNLPGSEAYELGMAALVLLFIAQIIGNFSVCCKFWSRNHDRNCKIKLPKIIIISLILSWVSFGVAVILIGAGTSISQSQLLGDGWLDGECYIVKDGVYIGSAVLILITLVGSTLSSAFITTMSKRDAEELQGIKVQAKADSA